MRQSSSASESRVKFAQSREESIFSITTRNAAINDVPKIARSQLDFRLTVPCRLKTASVARLAMVMACSAAALAAVLVWAPLWSSPKHHSTLDNAPTAQSSSGDGCLLVSPTFGVSSSELSAECLSTEEWRVAYFFTVIVIASSDFLESLNDSGEPVGQSNSKNLCRFTLVVLGLALEALLVRDEMPFFHLTRLPCCMVLLLSSIAFSTSSLSARSEIDRVI
jgi:hypothetical protein